MFPPGVEVALGSVEPDDDPTGPVRRRWRRLHLSTRRAIRRLALGVPVAYLVLFGLLFPFVSDHIEGPCTLLCSSDRGWFFAISVMGIPWAWGAFSLLGAIVIACCPRRYKVTGATAVLAVEVMLLLGYVVALFDMTLPW